jgi:peroxiredoxin
MFSGNLWGPSMLLKQELEAFKTAFTAGLSPELAAVMARGDAEVEATRVTNRALKAGDFAPDFGLPDRHGRIVRLPRLLSHGPLVISFIRGDWCPYCSLEMQALASVLPDIQQAGGSVVAISPQLPGLGTQFGNAIPPFPILFDQSALVATAYRLAFTLPNILRPLYEKFGHALPEKNGGGWMLPVPGTYLVNPTGRIALSFVDTDYRNRLEPGELIAAIRCLATDPAHRQPISRI